MVTNHVYFSFGNESVDASLITKAEAVVGFSKKYSFPFSSIATIGDGSTDLPMLKIRGLGLIGAPANAQPKVIEYVESAQNGWVCSGECLDGFFQFYEIARKREIKFIFSDRDGVLVRNEDLSRGEEFKQLAKSMGIERPLVIVLTGSAYEQNIDFMKAYGLDSSLADNHAVQEFPHLVLAENGYVRLNVLAGTVDVTEDLEEGSLSFLKRNFENEITGRIERELFQPFDLQWGKDQKDQAQKLYVPKKRSMVTINIPRTYANGISYRNSEDATMLRQKILDIMVDTAKKFGMEYEML